MKKLVIIICGFLLLGCSVKTKDKPESSMSPMKIAVSSDFHFQQENLESQTSVVPQMIVNVEIVEALLNQIKEENFDVLILCGDNTNNAIVSDHQALIQQLTDLKNQGIEIVVVPGNHDIAQLGKEEYRKLYQKLVYDEAYLVDSNSLSYVQKLQENLWVLVIDTIDEKASGGKISQETFQWMKQVLRQANENQVEVIFASHHNVLQNSLDRYASTYLIDNPDLSTQLEKSGVQLALSGHRHVGQVAKENNLIEIVSSMPIAWPNNFGVLEIDENKHVKYHLENIEVQNVPNFKQFSKEANQKREEETVAINLKDISCSSKEYRQMEELFILTSNAYYSGKLAENQKELLSHPGFSLWQTLAKDVTYSDWLDYLLHKEASFDSQISFAFQENEE